MVQCIHGPFASSCILLHPLAFFTARISPFSAATATSVGQGSGLRLPKSEWVRLGKLGLEGFEGDGGRRIAQTFKGSSCCGTH